MNVTCQLCGIVHNADEHCKGCEVNHGVQAMHTKMLNGRQTIREYLRIHAACAAKCHDEYNKLGDLVNAAYRNGMWYAYRDIERMIEQNGFKTGNDGMVSCPFCGKSGFSLAGLKGHLKHEDCEQFRNAPTPVRLMGL